MRIHTGFEIAYDCPAPTLLMLCLSVHPTRRAALETPDVLLTAPYVPVRQYIDGFGNICSRVMAPAGRFVLSADFIIHDSGQVDDFAPSAAETPVEYLPDDVLVYLLGSRYCETDKLSDIAWSLFAHTTPGWARVQTITDFVHNHIVFGYEHARPTKGAHEAYVERTGVCRDYAHLAVAFCRAMNIPARYCTGYLGDIGVPIVGEMDFSAWFEVYLDGRWYAFDARNNRPRIGRVLIARGRDATDVAISNAFGEATLVGFKVVSEDLPT
ncbi:transglutaminase family protein [Phenylobacterium sp.]|uniref:transglutaminase-like domain-containing protein n=1 Tax=Phenylobacterium sp. TaxID=1871053 RepID=UPI002F3FD288